MNEKTRQFIKDWAPFLGCALAITLLSCLQGRWVPRSRLFHLYAHWAEYALLGACLTRAFWREMFALGFWRSWIWGALFVVVFAALDEWHQTFVPGRMGRLDTVALDTVCAFFGCCFYFVSTTLRGMLRSVLPAE